MANSHRSASDRFWEKVEKSSGCWIWVGYIHPHGYGQFSNKGQITPAHRWSYEQANGAIPDGLSLDHLCRNRACVNPEHLEPVSTRENVQRGFDARLNGCCRAGHRRTPENTHVRSDGSRYCRECKRIRDRRDVGKAA